MKYIELEKAIGAVEGAFKFEVESAENYRDIEVHHARKHFIFGGSGKECGGLHRRSVKGGELMKYIDAELLKQILKPIEWGTPDERWVPEHEIGAMLDYFPTADVAEVRHGRWELYDICSVCGAQAEQQTNYCPNCGCRMDLDEVTE